MNCDDDVTINWLLILFSLSVISNLSDLLFTTVDFLSFWRCKHSWYYSVTPEWLFLGGIYELRGLLRWFCEIFFLRGILLRFLKRNMQKRTKFVWEWIVVIILLNGFWISMVASNLSMVCPDFCPVCLFASNLFYISFTILLILLSTLECQLVSGKVSHSGTMKVC